MTTHAQDAVQPLTYSLKEFCKAVGISLRTYYAMRERGEAPPVISIGSRRLIRADAAKKWLKEREEK